jgi:hypothetical protein
MRFRGRYWGQSGRALLHCICPLLTQRGHWGPLPERQFLPVRCPVVGLGGGNEAARVHQFGRRRGGMAARC